MKWTRERFLEERRKSVGGSDIGAILGISPFSTPRKVYEEKVNGLVSGSNKRMELGTFLEEPIARMYQAETGYQVEAPAEPIVRNPKFQELHASPDRFAYVQGKRRPVEIKYSADFSGWGQEGTDEVPAHYKAQCLHYLLVLEEEEMDIAVLLPGSFRVYTVRYEADTALEMARAARDFWAQHVMAQWPPPLDVDHAADLALASKLSGIRQTLELELPALQEGLLREYLELSQKAKEAKHEHDKLKAVILEMMGEAGFARGREGFYAVRRQVRRKEYLVQESQYVVLSVGKK